MPGPSLPRVPPPFPSLLLEEELGQRASGLPQHGSSLLWGTLEAQRRTHLVGTWIPRVVISGKNFSLSLHWGHRKQSSPAWKACCCRRGTDEQCECCTFVRYLLCPRSIGRASYLDAAPVEPGLPAAGAHHGVVGELVSYTLQANDAQGFPFLLRLHCLDWAVLLTEGPE